MQLLHAPKGTFTYDRLKKLADMIYRSSSGEWFAPQDIYHDLIMCLLDGQTLLESFHTLRVKYQATAHSVIHLPEISWERLLTEPSDLSEPLEGLKRASLLQEFYGAIRVFSLENQHLMILKLMGHTGEEIAEMMNWTHENVRVRFFRCMKALRRLRHGG